MDSQENQPKTKNRLWVIVIVIILIAILTGLFLYIKNMQQDKKGSPPITKNNNTNKNQQSNIKIEPKSSKIDREKAVTAIFGQEGGTMSTRAEDGTLYTLTVPGDALILPAEVSMSPLTESPVTGIEKPAAGYGVYLDGQFSFIRASYLTIQPNTAMPSQGTNKAATWGRCNIGSRGYDPEICINSKRIPFSGGIEPGKAVFQVINSEDDKRVLLASTIPIGEKNVYNGQVFRPGAYFGDKIDKNTAAIMAQKSFSYDSDYSNATEVLMHLLTLGGDLNPYKEEIERFAREEKSYPRETLKGAILAKAIADEETYNSRIENFKTVIEKNFKDVRSSYLPFPRYVALLNQLQIKRSNTTSFLFKKVMAVEGSWPVDLPDYDENARNDSGGSSWCKDILNSLNQRFRDVLGSSIYSCSEKAWASESLEMLGTIDAADRQAISSILGKCANQCKTLEECERQGDIADKNGDSDAKTAALYRMTAFLEQGTDCTSQTKKNLSNYGQNFCN